MDSYASGKYSWKKSEDNASVSEQTRQQLMALANAPFNEALTIPLTTRSWISACARLLLQLVIRRSAGHVLLRSRSEDIGQSSVNTLSSNLSYDWHLSNQAA